MCVKINVSVAELLTRRLDTHLYSFDTPTTPDNIAVNIDEQIAGNPAASFAASHMYGSESTLANTSVDIQKQTILKKLRLPGIQNRMRQECSGETARERRTALYKTDQ